MLVPQPVDAQSPGEVECRRNRERSKPVVAILSVTTLAQIVSPGGTVSLPIRVQACPAVKNAQRFKARLEGRKRWSPPVASVEAAILAAAGPACRGGSPSVASLTVQAQVLPEPDKCVTFPAYIEPRDGGYKALTGTDFWSDASPCLDELLRSQGAKAFASLRDQPPIVRN